VSKWRRLKNSGLRSEFEDCVGAAMNARDRDLSRLLSAVAMRAGERLVELRKTGGDRAQARFDRGRPMFITSTPSDVRAIKNTAAMAKRVLR
jgi:hypothetical protein